MRWIRHALYFGCVQLTCQSQLLCIGLAEDQARQSESIEERSSSVPLRRALRLNGAGVIRLVTLDGTNPKAAMQPTIKTIRSQRVRMNGLLRSFRPQGHLWYLNADSIETSKTVTPFLSTNSCEKRTIAEEKRVLTITLAMLPRSVMKNVVHWGLSMTTFAICSFICIPSWLQTTTQNIQGHTSMKAMPASKSRSSRIDSVSVYQYCLVYREVMQTKVIFWRILRNDGIRFGLMRRCRSGLCEGVYVFVDWRKQTRNRDRFFHILQEDGIWCGITCDGECLALGKGQ